MTKISSQIFTLFQLLRNNFYENRKNLNRCLWRCKTWRRPNFLGNHNAFMLQMPLKIKQILIKAKNTFSEKFKRDPFSKSWKLRPFFFCNLAPISASHFYDSEICPKIQQWIAREHYQCIKDFILSNLLKIGKFGQYSDDDVKAILMSRGSKVWKQISNTLFDLHLFPQCIRGALEEASVLSWVVWQKNLWHKSSNETINLPQNAVKTFRNSQFRGQKW